MTAFLEVQQLNVGVGSTPILNQLDIRFPEGDVTALLGHNGSGKSTLLNVLARQITPQSGQVILDSRPVSLVSSRDFSKAVGYLPQYPPDTHGLTVRELVALGRYPWRGAFGRYTEEDHRIIDRAIADTGLGLFAGRLVDTLSGGERQRAWIAMLLAQNTRCLLLDEPISALDMRHQVTTLQLIRRLADERNLTVIMVLHDVNLAARFCDRLLALGRYPAGSQLIADGAPAEIMNQRTLSDIYGVAMGVLQQSPGQRIAYVH